MTAIQVHLSHAAQTELDKYGYRNRKLRTTLTRIRWRERKKRTRNPRTRAELKEMFARRQLHRQKILEALMEGQEKIEEIARELFETFGTHTFYWWYMALLQSSIKIKKRRKTTKWNAWLYLTKTKRKSEGLPKLTAPALARLARLAWGTMSASEQKEATEDAIKELDERKEMRNLALHNVPIAAFHDTRATQQQIKTQFSEMCTRTNSEGILINVRTDYDHFSRPWVVTSSERVDQFFQTVCGLSVADFTRRLESYCLSGAANTAEKLSAELNKLRAEVVSLINAKLQDAARPDIAGRMFYTNFEDHITHKYGLIIEGWPLKVFDAPGHINSRPDLNTLLNAFTQGTARFRRLSDTEFAQWEKAALPGTFGLHGVWNCDLEQALANQAASEGVSPNGEEPLPTPEASTTGTEPDDDTVTRPPQNPPIPEPPTAAPPSQAFVFSLDPTSEAPKTKKKRKERSDKGKKRGPNARAKKARVAEPEAGQSS